MEKMSRHPVPLTPAGFLPPATHGVLKSLLENPVKLPLHHEGKCSESPCLSASCQRSPRGVKCAGNAQTFFFFLFFRNVSAFGE